MNAPTAQVLRDRLARAEAEWRMARTLAEVKRAERKALALRRKLEELED